MRHVEETGLGSGKKGQFSGGRSVKETGLRNSAVGAHDFGFQGLSGVQWNLPEAALYEHAIRNNEAVLTQGGALSADTGVHTGRSPKDKFVVVDAMTENTVWWDNNGRLSQENFKTLFNDFIAHAKGKELTDAEKVALYVSQVAGK